MQNKCNNNHAALFYLTDLKRTNMIQFVCLECDNLVNLTQDQTMNNIVYRQTTMDPFAEYMNIIRPKYKRLINSGLTPIDAVNELNKDKEENKVLKKTTNN